LPTPVSRQAFIDCYELLDRAIESTRGIQRLFDDHGAAMNFRVRLHKARAYDRHNNQLIYQPDDPLYAQTIYAQIVVREPRFDPDRGKWVLKLEKGVVEEMDIEEIPGPRIEEESALEDIFDQTLTKRRG